MTRNPAFFEQKAVRLRRAPYQRQKEIVWTDMHSDPFRVLR